ncbi:MAG TPA: DUF4097 family beta strand repeat-containing protein [Bacteroidota bacterium]|nr:DUF4097 family beta strand repeat-containing protein [Bacteroidota bacterium]
MYPNRRIGALVVLLLLIAGTAVCAQKKFEKKFQVSPGGTLTLGTDAGSVKVLGTSSNEVSVVADIRGREKDVESFSITADQSGNNVDVQGKLNKGGSWFWNSVDIEVQYTVTVPREYSLKMHTSGGDIVVSDLKGKVDGKTSGGNVSIGNSEGDVDLETSGGNVEAEKVKGLLRMRTSGGEIDVRGITGDVDLGTSGGDVKVSDVEGKVRAETSGGDMYVKVRGSNKGVYAETSGGDIEIVVSKSIAADIDAATSGGSVHFDFPVTLSGQIDESRVRGTLNGGGNKIHAHTSGGDVRFRSAD